MCILQLSPLMSPKEFNGCYLPGIIEERMINWTLVFQSKFVVHNKMSVPIVKKWYITHSANCEIYGADTQSWSYNPIHHVNMVFRGTHQTTGSWPCFRVCEFAVYCVNYLHSVWTCCKLCELNIYFAVQCIVSPFLDINGTQLWTAHRSTGIATP